MELKEAMNIRKSIRSYTGEQISKEQLDAILIAAYEAPIGMGKFDSIHLTVITNKELLNELDANAALEQNKDLLAKLNLPEGFSPLGALAVGKTNETYTKREIPDAHKYSTNEIQ